MRILYLNHNVTGGGTFHRAHRVAAGVAGCGHEVTLVTTSRNRLVRGSEREVDGVRVIEAPDLLTGGARQGWDVWNTSWRIARLRRDHYDLIHAFDCRPAVIGPALTLRRQTGAPLFIDWADWWGRGGTISTRSGWAVRTLFGPVETWFEEAFRCDATANTVISAALRDRCAALGVPADRIHVLPNGCLPPRHSSEEVRRRARATLGIPVDRPVLVHVGRMLRADAELLFGALRRTRARVPTAQLVLIGEPVPVPGDLAGGETVHQTGFLGLDALWTWLAAADAGVVPLTPTIANTARWPSKVNDYFSAGLPVVLPRVGAAAEFVERAGAGWTCAPDAGSFARAMVAALTDDASRTVSAAAAHALAAGELAWGPIVDRLLEWYGMHAQARRLHA